MKVEISFWMWGELVGDLKELFIMLNLFEIKKFEFEMWVEMWLIIFVGLIDILDDFLKDENNEFVFIEDNVSIERDELCMIFVEVIWLCCDE